MSRPVRHFVDLWKLEGADLRAILDDARARKQARKGWPQGRADADRPAAERLRAVASTTDGFELSQLDVAMRSEGDVLGTRQSGLGSLKNCGRADR